MEEDYSQMWKIFWVGVNVKKVVINKEIKASDFFLRIMRKQVKIPSLKSELREKADLFFFFFPTQTFFFTLGSKLLPYSYIVTCFSFCLFSNTLYCQSEMKDEKKNQSIILIL